MTDRKERPGRAITSAGRDRRRFMAKTAAAAVGAYAAAIGSTVRAADDADDKIPPQTGCPNIKTPMKDVAGKVAFITGGSSGIGLGIARAFTDAGMKVVIGYRTPQHRDDAMRYLQSAGDRVHAVSVDVADRPGMEKAAAETVKVFGKVHVLVNNAGVITMGGIRDTTYDDWDWVLSVNCTGVFNGVHAFLPHMEAHGEGGHILTTSSVAGLFAWAGLGGYSASKFAVVGLMEALRMELEKTNIGVSVFCPGSVRGDPNAARNRPSQFGNVGVKVDAAALDRSRKAKSDPERSMDPIEAGQLVLRGMRNNDLYILTHPEFTANIQDRSDALAASALHDVSVTDGRRKTASSTRHAVYATERDRKHCVAVRSGTQ